MSKLLWAAILFIAVTICLSSTGAAAEKLYPFSLGTHSEDGNELEFTFPGSGTGSLYLFNMKKGNFTQPRARKTWFLVRLYDAGKRVMDTGESVGIPPQMDSFGSVAFSLDKEKTREVRYFSITIQTRN